MEFRSLRLLAIAALTPLIAAAAVANAQPLSQRILRYDENTPVRGTPVHQGAGTMKIHRLIGPDALPTNVGFFEQGVLLPKSSIGQHFHHASEEMFVILDGDAQFTIDGRTSVVKGPAAVPVRLGSSHAVYNPTDRPMIWLDISVSALKGVAGGFDLGDDRVGAALDPIPQFVNARFDTALLRDTPALNGGTGVVRYRRLFAPTVFLTPWSYVDHVAVPNGASIGPNAARDMTEMYYVISGQGSVAIGQETAPLRQGDLIAIGLDERKSFTGSGAAPLEMMIVGVARNMDAKTNFMLANRRPAAPPPAR